MLAMPAQSLHICWQSGVNCPAQLAPHKASLSLALALALPFYRARARARAHQSCNRTEQRTHASSSRLLRSCFLRCGSTSQRSSLFCSVLVLFKMALRFMFTLAWRSETGKETGTMPATGHKDSEGAVGHINRARARPAASAPSNRRWQLHAPPRR